MATISLGKMIDENDNICQGDIFRSVKYSFIEKDHDDEVHILEYEFPHAIIISQACDVISAGDLNETKEGKPTKFMSSILLCPIFGANVLKSAKHLERFFCDDIGLKDISGKDERLFSGDDLKVTNKDWHYRFHKLTVNSSKGDSDNQQSFNFENLMIDFKQYFTLPPGQLLKSRKNRVCRLNDLFAEQITLKFCTFLSRVAIPDEE